MRQTTYRIVALTACLAACSSERPEFAIAANKAPDASGTSVDLDAEVSSEADVGTGETESAGTGETDSSGPGDEGTSTGGSGGGGTTSASGGTDPGTDGGKAQLADASERDLATDEPGTDDGGTDDQATEPSCTAPGTHLCGNECVSDTSADSCGDSCKPCPAPTNGEATCNDGSCGTSCPDGTHLCGSACVDNADPATCGGSCSPCSAPTGGEADCDGTQCLPLCPDGMKLCEGACVSESTFCAGEEKADGESCTEDFECASLSCEDGVCCNTACDGQCEACDLPGSMGTCSPSTTARASDPCAGDGSSCSGFCDGSEAHRDSCVYPASGTLCGASASCSTSTNQARTAETCNGTGLCSDATVTNCSPYACDGSVCDTSCPSGEGVCGGSCVNIQTDPSHCGTSCTACGPGTPKCVSGNCRECTSNSDCSSPGSVCDSNNTCGCRQPSATNLLLNPGFDSSSTNWETPLCADVELAAHDATQDADRCARSGSMELTYYGLCFGSLAQCRPVSASTSYRYGFDYLLAVAGSEQVRCAVEEHSGSSCSGSVITSQDVSNTGSTADSWTHQTAMFLTSSTTGSVRLNCQVNNLNTIWIDQIYLNATTNNEYF